MTRPSRGGGACPGAAALWLLAALPLWAGCARTIWSGRDPGRQHLVELVAQGDEQRLRVDGRDHPATDGVGLDALAFDPTGAHVAYPVRRGARWAVVHDGVAGPADWDGVGEVVLSPDGRRVVFAAERDGAWTVVADGQPGPPFDAVLARTLRFDGRGAQVAWAGQRGGAVHVVRDGVVGPAFVGVSRLDFGADGRLVYVGRRGGRVCLVDDGVESAPVDAVAEVALPPRGGAPAWIAASAGGARAVVGGTAGPLHDQVAGLRFTPDGAGVAYAAREGAAAFVVDRGRAGPRFDGVRYETLTFGPDGAPLYVARRNRAYVVVAGADVGPPFDWIERPVASARRWGYVARRGDRHVVVLDGRPRHRARRAAEVSELTLAAAGDAYAFVVRHGPRAFVVKDGRRAATLDAQVPGTLVLTPDGRHWACLAGAAATKEWFVTLDGRARRPLDLAELADRTQAGPFEAPTDLLRGWVSAELALWVRAGAL